MVAIHNRTFLISYILFLYLANQDTAYITPLAFCVVVITVHISCSTCWVIDKALCHIDLCAIEYSLVDAHTALKHGDEACLHIWHLMSNLSIASPNLSCELLTDKMNLLIKCSSAI